MSAKRDTVGLAQIKGYYASQHNNQPPKKNWHNENARRIRPFTGVGMYRGGHMLRSEIGGSVV